MPPRVYVVDDDSLVTTSLGTALRLETDFEVMAWNEASEALLAIEATPPDVVLSDLKMPRMDGIAFLKQVRARVPDAVLMLLTGYADKESAIAAINEVGIWQYVEKPWDTTDLLLKVRQGLERRDLVRDLSRTNRELAARVAELGAAREQLVQSERLAAVGRVMSGLLHEVGNQLGLLGYAELIRDQTTDPEIAGFARTILDGQRRLAGMIGEIRDFTRGGETSYALAPGDMAAVAEEAVSILRFDRDARDRRVVVTIGERPLARLHRGKLMQAVLNLVRNAAQATPVGGVVEVKVSVAADGGGEVRVEDHGPGMPPEVVARLGEPFFTTKEGGTGLGLGITRRIVADHGGALAIESAPGRGTAMTIRLPPLPATP